MGRLQWVGVLLLWLWPRLGATSEPSTDDTPAPTPASQLRPWHILTRLEMATLALLPRAGGGEGEGFAQVEPTLVLDGGPDFGVSMGAPVRLRLWGGKGTGLVRREDWDSLSDWGQLVRALKLGSDASSVSL